MKNLKIVDEKHDINLHWPDIRFLHSNNFQSHFRPLPNLHILKRQSTSQSPQGWWT
jgi:hypothetical protein